MPTTNLKEKRVGFNGDAQHDALQHWKADVRDLAKMLNEQMGPADSVKKIRRYLLLATTEATGISSGDIEHELETNRRNEMVKEDNDEFDFIDVCNMDEFEGDKTCHSQ